jgi:hypothetical protein
MPFDRQLIEAQLAMGLIASADMPKIAWDALAADLDGPAIRRLAALEKPTFFEVDEVLTRAMQEMGLTRVEHKEAALRIARHLVAEILQSGDDPTPRVRELESLWIRSDYCRELQELGTLADDVWIGNDMGQRHSDIRDFVTSALKNFIAR